MLRTIALASLTVALTTSANAQQTATTTVPICDETFAMKANCGGIVEITMSKLALQRSSNPEVRKFAQHMIEDHTMVGKQLAEVAAQKRIPLTTTLDPIHVVVEQRLAQLSGSDFDKEFIKQQKAAHMEAIHCFSHEPTRARTPS